MIASSAKPVLDRLACSAGVDLGMCQVKVGVTQHDRLTERCLFLPDLLAAIFKQLEKLKFMKFSYVFGHDILYTVLEPSVHCVQNHLPCWLVNTVSKSGTPQRDDSFLLFARKSVSFQALFLWH